jgi:hypothetical protein
MKRSVFHSGFLAAETVAQPKESTATTGRAAHASCMKQPDDVACLVGSFSGSSRMRKRRRSCSSSGLVWCPTPE